jgi:hypothetical protein
MPVSCPDYLLGGFNGNNRQIPARQGTQCDERSVLRFAAPS